MLKKLSEEAKHQFESKLWIGRTVGVTTLDGKLINPQLIFVFAVAVFEQTMQFHGLRESWPHLAPVCNSLVVLFLILQSVTRFTSKLINNDDDIIQSMLNTVIEFYDREEKNHDYRLILIQRLKVSKEFLNGYLIFCFAMFCIPNPTAWIVSWYTDEFILFTPIYLSFIDPNTLFGYIVNSTLLVFFTFLLYLLLMVADVLFIYFVYQCIPMMDIFCLKFYKLNENISKVKELKKVEPTTSKNIKTNEKFKVEDQLIDLIKEFKVYNDYVQTLVKFMKFTTLLALSQNSLAIAMSIVVTLKYSKAIGTVMFIILSFQVLMPCVQGSLITHQKEKLLNELYRFPYYELSKHNQKMFLQFIHLCQNSNELKIPIIGVLNMEIFTNVMNDQFESKLWIGQIVGVTTFDGRIINERLIFTISLGALEQVMHFRGLQENIADFASISNIIVAFYKREKQIHENQPVLIKHLKILKMLLNSYLLFFLIVYCIPNPTAWIVSWYTGEFILVAPIYLPFLDPKTLSGYITSSAILVFYTMLIYICLMIADILYIYLIYQCVPMMDIYCLKLKKFGNDLIKAKIIATHEKNTIQRRKSKKILSQETSANEQKAEINEIEKQLIDLIKEFKTYNIFIRKVIYFMKSTAFVALSMNSMAMAMSIVVAQSYSSLIGGAIFMVLSFQVLMPCIEGSLIIHQKEKLLNELYDFPWYELSKPKQKMFLQFIHLCQNSNELQIFLIGTLNMKRFADLMNAVYNQFESKLWIGRIFGVATFDGKEINARLIFTVLMGILEQVMHIHGLKQSWSNIAYICNSMAIYCLVIQLLVRLSSKFINNDDKNLQSLLNTIVTFYEREEKNHEYREVLVKNLKILDILLNGYLLFFFIIFCIPNPTAWIVSWYTDEFILFTPIYLPFLDPKTLIGYAINCTLLVFYTMLAYVCFMTADVNIMYFIYQSIPIIDIFCIKIEKFGVNLMKMKNKKILSLKVNDKNQPSNNNYLITGESEQENILYFENELIELIKEFHVYNYYVQSTVNFMKFTTFVALSTNSIAIAMSIVVAFKYSKAIGIVIMVILCMQVLMPCIQGSIIAHQKKKLLNELYRFPYYELTKHKQKMFLQFIHLCQNSNELEIAIIDQLENKLWIGQIIGATTFDGTILNKRLICAGLVGFTGQIIHFFGIQENLKDFASVCNSLAIYSFIIQILIRYGNKIIFNDDVVIHSLLGTITAFFDREEQIHEHRPVLIKNLKILKILLNGYLVFFFIIYTIPNPTSWILSWYTGEFILIVPIDLPFIDPKTLIGYIVCSSILMFYSVFVYVCLMIGDILFIYLVYQCVPMMDIYCLKLKKFGDNLIKIKNEKIQSVEPSTSKLTKKQLLKKREEKILKNQNQLIDFIKEFHVYNCYLETLIQFMKFTTFGALSMNSLAIGMAIVVALNYSKAIGLYMATSLFFQVFVPCIQGTLMLHQKEKLLNELYDFPWFELSKDKQKIFLQFIHLCQNSNELEIAIVGDVDMELFKDIINGAYSYFIYLKDFVKNN
ncbi:hypothetical protein PVAND_011219 [Polypedilum vanderplanki]|uniref:Odorant receptor n=1 Tax=Polypedilum vanderplanki TaxID=319348 RepID=A0A9J6CJA4_POLVA|nr:hypothetical protein PVAND_011219 [Polypedilum vanderplanki]